MRLLLIASAAALGLGAAACGKDGAATNAGASPAAAAEPAAAPSDAVDFSVAKSGAYTTDYKHRYITFSYSHFGFSTPHLRWRDWTGELEWNAENPEKSSVFVTIDANSADSGVDEFDGHLRSDRFFDVANHPEIIFESTSLERTGPNTGKMTGDLTIKEISKPVTLDVVINKAAFDEQRGQYKLGFSARGVVKRSDYGVDLYAPLVSDEVNLVIEAEFTMQAAAE